MSRIFVSVVCVLVVLTSSGREARASDFRLSAGIGGMSGIEGHGALILEMDFFFANYWEKTYPLRIGLGLEGAYAERTVTKSVTINGIIGNLDNSSHSFDLLLYAISQVPLMPIVKYAVHLFVPIKMGVGFRRRLKNLLFMGYHINDLNFVERRRASDFVLFMEIGIGVTLLDALQLSFVVKPSIGIALTETIPNSFVEPDPRVYGVVEFGALLTFIR